MGHTPVRWDLADLAATGDLAADFQVSKSTVSNWVERYDDFPAPLIELSSGPIWSRGRVHEWHDARDWKPGRPRKHAAAGRG